MNKWPNHRLSSATRTRIVDRMMEWHTTLTQIQPFFKIEITQYDLEMIKQTAHRLKTYITNGKKYRICNSCKSHKEETTTNFRWKTKEHTIFHATCRACKNTQARAAQLKDIKTHRARAREYFHKNKHKYPKSKSKKLEDMTPQEKAAARVRRAKASRKKRALKLQAKLQEKREALNEVGLNFTQTSHK